MNDMTTPKKITPQIITFCATINGGEPPPEYVDVRPVEADVDICVEVVERHVRRYGGTAMNGWTIWEWPFTLLEAQFHTIWIDGNGKKTDISPKPDGETRILFLPDPQHPFPSDQWVPSRYVPLRDHERIHEFIRLKAKRITLLPPPNSETLVSACSPLVLLDNRLESVTAELTAMANVRKKSKKRDGRR